MVKPFSKSKRVPVRLRHKIEKSGAAKQRKLKKEAKKNPQWKSRLKKDPGIPNLFPFKEKLLEEIEEKKRLKAEVAQRRRDATRENKDPQDPQDRASRPQQSGQNPDGDDDNDDEFMQYDYDPDGQDDDMSDGEFNSANPLAALVASAQERALHFDGGIQDGDISGDEHGRDGAYGAHSWDSTPVDYRSPDLSRRAFDKIFKQVLDAADVVLYVLDARDPDGTRSQEVEHQVAAAEAGSKRLILVLNKIDLVPPPVLSGWLTHLRRYFPTIPLRASNPASNAQTFDHKQLTLQTTSESLLRALKSYAASKQLKRAISVGVIGYPNVGKSSVINALTSRLNKRNHGVVCPVGSEAGVTASLREVKIDSKLKILDSPGIIFQPLANSDATAKEDRQRQQEEHEAHLVLLNALPPKQISDPIPAVKLLLSRLSASDALYEKMLKHYGIVALGPFAHGDTTTDFLVQVARKRGRLGKGGVPNLSGAAMTVVTDWRDGRIQGWIEPPRLAVVDDTDMGEHDATTNGRAPLVDRKEIVKEWAAEFQLD